MRSGEGKEWEVVFVSEQELDLSTILNLMTLKNVSRSVKAEKHNVCSSEHLLANSIFL